MSIVIGPLPKGKRGIIISEGFDFDGLREVVEKKYGKGYEFIGFRRDKKGKEQMLIGKIVEDGKEEVRIEESEKR